MCSSYFYVMRHTSNLKLMLENFTAVVRGACALHSSKTNLSHTHGKCTILYCTVWTY